MDKYRPNYQDYPPPPPPPDMPPLPRGPPPPLSWNGHGDSYRPSDSRYYPQERIPQSDFTFRNDNYAPHYPREQDHPRDMQPGQSQYATRENDYSRGAQPTQYARQGDNRPRARNSHRDDANINRPRRGNHQNNRPYKVAPADRPLLRRQNDGGNSPEQMLGMATGQAKFMAAGDVSDSGEEQMELSDSEVGQVEENHEQLATPNTAGSEHPDEEASERPTKRRATATGSRDGASEPKWSNPDPYTVLPPVDDEQRKRKDVVKLIRKARKDADDGKTGEHNQVAANDDFISFGMDDGMDDEPTTIDEAPSSPRPDWREEYGPGVPGAPSEPRAFSHLQNLHNQNNGAPGTNGHTVLADSMGPPPGLAQAPTAPPSLPEQVVLDTYPFESEDTSNSFGNRKRNHDCISKSESGRPMQKSKKSPPVQANGSILADWVPSPELDPTPWLQRPGFLTANAGFRLHKEICDFYEFVKPQNFEQTIRQELLSRLQDVVSKHIPHANVQCFGSYAAGLYLPTADMDVVVISNSYRSSGQKVVCQNNSQMFKFSRFLENSGLAAPGSLEVVTGAKVPIIKFVDRVTAIKVDVSFENDSGIIANNTFARWKEQFPAMPILVTIVKQFLMMRGLNEVMYGGLGGFSVTCLVTSLLQNMPRVQSGELVPEQHLGEMLIEFLDFYGNRLDNARTGLMMNPPGYFDKSEYYRPNSKRQLYKANRLAIMDPNRPDNDISGGSLKVMLIFDRFSKAHAEILRAMQTPNRPSLLDWALAGNYESFVWQRNRLLDLYTERRGVPAGAPKQYELPQQRTPASNASLAEFQGFAPASSQNGAGKIPPTGLSQGNKPALTGNHRPVAQKRQESVDIVFKSGPAKDNKPGVHTAKTVSSQGAKAKSKLEIASGEKSRANSLRKQFPNATNIPVRITKRQRKDLVAQLTGIVSAPQAPNVGNLPPAKRRAGALKEQFPQLARLIPDEISSNQKEAFIEKHGKAGKNQEAIYKREPDPPSEVRSCAENLRREQTQYPGAQVTSVNKRHSSRSSFVTAPQTNERPAEVCHPLARPSDKMAPLSDERRAEVARNLSGYSRDDPIDID